MDLETDRQEATVRLLQNGRYVWTISINTRIGDGTAIAKLKQMDGELRNAFPNHVKESAVRFKEFEE